MLKAKLLAVAAMLALPQPAHALCVYHGELSAKTTLAQEFGDAPLVARARVLAAWDRDIGEERSTTYRLEVVQSFKGALPATFHFVTERNSGGFYLDSETGPDIGGEYLLFLNRGAQGSSGAADAFAINYSCGQSRRWDEVSPQDRARLAALSDGR